MAKRYIKIGWENKPSVKTPVNMANLGRMDKGIDDCDNAIEEIYSKRVNNVVTTNEDTFLAGPVGKVLQDQVTELNKNSIVQDKTSEILFSDGITNDWLGCRVYKCGKMVTLRVNAKKTDDSNFGNATILTLPVSCRPVVSLIFVGGIGGQYEIYYPVYLYINATGEVSVNVAGTNTNKVVHATVTYLAN